MYNNKKVRIAVLIAAILLMVVGYAAFSSRLNVSGTANIASSWNVYFSNIKTIDVKGGAANNDGSPKVSNLVATMSADLKEPGDYIIYEITITNGGSLNAVVDKIDATEAGSPTIIYTISGIKTGDKIAKGNHQVFTVKIEYDKTIISQPKETTKVLTLNINCVQDLS